ncbi:MAG: DinB family protein [Phycisphaerae bacterium]|nr:DinB family protein [Phycisphaerae bacterium]
MRMQDMIAEAVLASKAGMARYLAGFSDETRARQAPGLPNHVAWSLGHCALTLHRVAEKLDGRGLPESEFGVGGERFDAESVAFGSVPIGDAARYPALSRCVAIYDGACDRLAGAVRASDEARLMESTRWGEVELPLWLLVLRMGFHNGMHTGQVADLRRALGFRSIFA